MVDNRDMSEQLREWVISGRNPPSIAHVVLSGGFSMAHHPVVS